MNICLNTIEPAWNSDSGQWFSNSSVHLNHLGSFLKRTDAWNLPTNDLIGPVQQIFVWDIMDAEADVTYHP